MRDVLFGGGCEETSEMKCYSGSRRTSFLPEDRIDAALLNDPPRSEEGVSQRQVSLGNGVKIGVQAAQHRVDEGVAEAEGRGRKHV